MGYEKLNKITNYILSKVSNLSSYAILTILIGRMGSGKTTLSKSIASKFAERVGGVCLYSSNYHILYKLDSLKSEQPTALVVDDVSFKLDREMLGNIFRIRHLVNSKVMLVLNCHYQRSIAPFLRGAQVRILTSLSEAEIKAYESEYLFTTSSLWDYLHYLYKYPDKYIILGSFYGREHIVDVTNEVFDICKEVEFKD